MRSPLIQGQIANVQSAFPNWLDVEKRRCRIFAAPPFIREETEKAELGTGQYLRRAPTLQNAQSCKLRVFTDGCLFE